MQQCLERAFRFSIDILLQFITRQFRQDSSDEVMLISEPCDPQTACLGTLSNTCPFDMRGDIGTPNFIEGRREKAMLGANLQRSGGLLRRVKLLTRMTVIDREHVTTTEFA